MGNTVRTEMKVVDNVLFGDSDPLKAFHAITLDIAKDNDEVTDAWQKWQPGQFVMVRPNWGKEILWARPFSIARVTSRGLVLFFQVVGKGTSQLANLVNGQKVTVWGPLGKGFTIDNTKPTLLLAGGMGLVPFLGYLDKHPKRGNLHMLFGHKQDIQKYPVESIAQHIEVDTYHETDDKSLGFFLQQVEKNMEEYKNNNGLVLACGPLPFLQFVHNKALELDIPTQLSLENKMACGIGACLGCVAKTTEHWPVPSKAGLPVQTCTSGPVFWAKDIEL